jgi:hypothetical protein
MKSWLVGGGPLGKFRAGLYRLPRSLFGFAIQPGRVARVWISLFRHYDAASNGSLDPRRYAEKPGNPIPLAYREHLRRSN